MASHSQDHYHTETKPVAFTVPFILALVTIVVMGLFLSLCDPKSHHGSHGAAGDDGHRHATEKELSPMGSSEAPSQPSAPAEGAQHH